MSLRTDKQLTLDVELHPALRDEAEPYIAGSISINGTLVCPHDVNAGHEVTVTVADADGNVIAQGVADATYPGFREIKDRGEVIGTERVNKVSVR